MGFFDNDSFESVVEKMFGGSGNFVEYTDSDGKKKVYQKAENNSSKNIVEAKEKNYFVLDLSNMKDVNVTIGDKIIKDRFGDKVGKEKVIEIKSSTDEFLEYILPRKFSVKKFDWTFNNGILEVNFEK